MKASTAYLGVILATLMIDSSKAWAQEHCVSATIADTPREASKEDPSSLESPDENPRVLLSGNLAHGGYGAPEVKVSSFAGQAGLLVGGKGAWVIGHSLTLGGGGYGLATRVDAPDAARGSVTDASLSLGYGGFRIGYIIFPHEIVHFSGGLLIGGGGISVIDRQDSSDTTIRSASVFVLEPEAAMEVNITRTIRGAIDVSYRYMSDSRIPGLSSSKIGGPAAGAMLAFGWF